MEKVINRSFREDLINCNQTLGAIASFLMWVDTETLGINEGELGGLIFNETQKASKNLGITRRIF